MRGSAGLGGRSARVLNRDTRYEARGLGSGECGEILEMPGEFAGERGGVDVEVGSKGDNTA